MTEDDSSPFTTVLQGSTIVFVGFGFEMLISFGAKLLIARYLGRVDYGEVSLGITIMTLVTAFSLVGLNTGIGRYIPRFDSQVDRGSVVRSAIEIALPLAVVSSIIIIFVSDSIATVLFDNPQATALIWIFAIAIPLVVLFRLSIGIIQGQQRSVPKVVLGNICLPGTRFGLIALAVFIGLGTQAFAGAYFLSYLVVAVAAMYYIFTRVSIPSTNQYTPMRRELVSFSAPLMITATITVFLSNIDTLMLGYFSTTSAVGVYNVVFPLTVMITAFLVSFRFIVMPQISELHANGRTEDIRRVYGLTNKWIMALSAPVLFVFLFFPAQVIEITFGAEYTAGALALSILSLGFFTHAVAGPNGATLTSIGKTRSIMRINIVVGICNIILNLLLIPQYSFVGAAIATGSSYALMNVLYSWQLYQSIGISPISNYTSRTIVIISLLFLPFGVIQYTIFTAKIPTLLLGASLLVIYVVLLFSTVISEPEERSFFETVIEYVFP
ncbi:flippase [Halobacterium salinarum]|uniref:flippase n=1 Tax=Halobacterium salinarum TaxID=2242 RepID=UPI001F1E1684|nr:flippase [Halobacterium salinarum]MCF2165497.1 flippase [Halobacterium salinarum]MCF2166683.1 flippase [Halobacterium salinarum]